jgi:hypothetical protein
MGFTEKMQAEQEIEAPPDRVWDVLMGFESFGEWNPFIVSIEGDRSIGSKLRVRLRPPGGRTTTFRPTVTASEPARAFGWSGRLGVSGVFDGAHRFDLEALPGDRTRFVQSERFRGVLVPLLRRSLLSKTLAGFEAMNRALAERAEAAP